MNPELSFRTRVEPLPWETRFSFQTPLMFLGSCFAETISQRLEELFFPVMANPSGVMYNPASMAILVDRLLQKQSFSDKEITLNQGLWFSYLHDTGFSHEDPAHCLEGINEAFWKAVNFLDRAEFLFLSFGTSWVFERAEDRVVVNNCHKLPAGHFRRRFMSTGEVIGLWDALLVHLKERFPNLTIVFTLSPVRHWKDGPSGNQESKASLFLAICELCRLHPHCFYFPAYEIMLDDLRDYRFYADDMLHPSPVAVDYILELLFRAGLSANAQVLLPEARKLAAALAHRPVRPHAPEHLEFKAQLARRIQEFLAREGAPTWPNPMV